MGYRFALKEETIDETMTFPQQVLNRIPEQLQAAQRMVFLRCKESTLEMRWTPAHYASRFTFHIPPNTEDQLLVSALQEVLTKLFRSSPRMSASSTPKFRLLVSTFFLLARGRMDD